jgi:hypothetical protein
LADNSIGKLVTGNPLFHQSLKYFKTEALISGFLPFLGPEKDFLSVAQSPIISAHRITILLNAASHVRHFSMGKN